MGRPRYRLTRKGLYSIAFTVVCLLAAFVVVVDALRLRSFRHRMAVLESSLDDFKHSSTVIQNAGVTDVVADVVDDEIDDSWCSPIVRLRGICAGYARFDTWFADGCEEVIFVRQKVRSDWDQFDDRDLIHRIGFCEIERARASARSTPAGALNSHSASSFNAGNEVTPGSAREAP